MVKNKQYGHLIESLEVRIENIRHFLQTLRQDRRYTVDCIMDPYGPTITDPSIDALVVSRETMRGGEAIQRERAARQLAPLAIHVIDVVAAGRQSLGQEEWANLKLGSTQIRARIQKEMEAIS